MDRLTARQINDWIEYNATEPFGEYRSELRNGELCALIANIKRDPKTKPEPFRTVDFMHFLDRPKEKPLTPEEVEQHLDRIFGA